MKSKNICDKNHPEPVEGLPSCQSGFTVAINHASTTAIQFNYWLIKTR